MIPKYKQEQDEQNPILSVIRFEGPKIFVLHLDLEDVVVVIAQLHLLTGDSLSDLEY